MITNRCRKEIGDLKDRIRAIRKEAYEDAMTNVLNRRAFDQEINTMMAMNKPFSLIMIDIDFFKTINDNLDMFGDQVLKAIAKRISDSCNNGEKIYRIGGEEFAFITTNPQITDCPPVC